MITVKNNEDIIKTILCLIICPIINIIKKIVLMHDSIAIWNIGVKKIEVIYNKIEYAYLFVIYYVNFFNLFDNFDG